MSPLELQSFMEDNIPLARNAGFRILEVSMHKIVIGGRLDENKNHHQTVFGGSITVILILSSWAMVQEIMNQEDPEASIVIASQTVNFRKPVKRDFEGVCSAPELEVYENFILKYRDSGRGKIEVEACLYEKDSAVINADFKGTFFVKQKENHSGP
jgi:thioesterase domain-containing protein